MQSTERVEGWVVFGGGQTDGEHSSDSFADRGKHAPDMETWGILLVTSQGSFVFIWVSGGGAGSQFDVIISLKFHAFEHKIPLSSLCDARNNRNMFGTMYIHDITHASWWRLAGTP